MPIVEIKTSAAAAESALIEDESDIRVILTWIGFTSVLLRARITEESFNDYANIEQMKKGCHRSKRHFPEENFLTKKYISSTKIKKL